MSVSHVQTVNNLSPIKSGYSSVTITGVTVGNLLVVTAQSTLAGSVTGVGDTFNSYQSAQGEQVSANGNTTRHFYCVVTTGGSLTLTLSGGGAPAYSGIYVSEYHSTNGWPAGAGAFDVGNGNSQASPGTGADAITSGVTATRHQASELLVCSWGDDTISGTSTETGGTNFTVPTNGSNGDTTSFTGGTEYQVVSSTGTDAGTAQHNPDCATECIISTFMDNAGATPSLIRPENHMRPNFFAPGIAR